eukprot:6669190-Pyramimonas_sp.AAC.1
MGQPSPWSACSKQVQTKPRLSFRSSMMALFKSRFMRASCVLTAPSFLSERLCLRHFGHPAKRIQATSLALSPNLVKPYSTSVASYLGLCNDEPIQHPSGQQGAVFRLLDILRG